jgi:catechol O-methyltransferase
VLGLDGADRNGNATQRAALIATLLRMFGSDSEDEEDEEIRPVSNGVMAFHNGTEEAMFLYAQRRGVEGDLGVFDAIDEFCMKRHWMMHAGGPKRTILADVLRNLPEFASIGCLNILELGSYCGYSSSFFASLLQEREADGHIVCVEPEAKCVEWTSRMHRLVGVDSYTTVLPTAVSALTSTTMNKDFLERVKATEKAPFQVLFIDHDKSKYLTDLKLLRKHGVLAEGCVVIADNVLSFNEPLDEYLDYVRGEAQSSLQYDTRVEYSEAQIESDPKGEAYYKDALEVSRLS